MPSLNPTPARGAILWSLICTPLWNQQSLSAALGQSVVRLQHGVLPSLKLRFGRPAWFFLGFEERALVAQTSQTNDSWASYVRAPVAPPPEEAQADSLGREGGMISSFHM